MLNRKEYKKLRTRLRAYELNKTRNNIIVASIHELYLLTEQAEEYGKTAARSEMARDNAIALGKVLSKYGISVKESDSVGFGDYLCALEHFLDKKKEEGEGINVGVVKPFPNVKPTKEQALKVLEEAAEVFGAWQEDDKGANCWKEIDHLSEALLDEIADLIQATCNLSASMGITDLRPYMKRCEQRNKARGRYFHSVEGR